MIILHPFNPLVRPEDQLDTWAVLEEIKRTMEIETIQAPCYEPNDYGIALDQWLQASVLAKARLIVIEHDIVPTLSQMSEIINCRHPWCVFDYKIPTDTGPQRWTDVLAWSHKSGDGHFPLGFSKFDLNSYYYINRLYKFEALGSTSWENVAYILSGIMHELGYDAHIHTDPVVHNHE